MTKYPTNEKTQSHDTGDELAYRISVSIMSVAILGFLIYALITS